jgi:predicted AAA+ superfamily ATPase
MIDLLKHYAYAKAKAGLSYYRDANTKEIDLFVEENNRIHPLEIKKSASPDRREVRKFSLLDKAQLERSYGGIVCMCEEVIPIDEMNCFIPCNLI